MEKVLTIVKQQIVRLKDNGAFHVVAGSFLTKFVSLFGSIFIVRLLTKTEYGILGYYENLMGYFFVLAGHGLSTAVLRYMVLADDIPAKKGCFQYTIRAGTVWNVCLLAVSLLFILFYPHKEAFRGQFPVGAMLMLCIPFIFLQNSALCTLRGLYRNKIYAYLAFGVAVIQISSRVAGAAIGGLGTTVKARFLAEALCGAACAVFVWKKFFSGSLVTPIDTKTRKEYDTYSYQVMLTNGLWTIFMLNDVFLLGQITGNETVVADYKTAYVIPANLSILVAAVGIFVAPYFTKYDKEKNYTWIRSRLKLVLCVTAGVMAAVCLLCFVFARPLVTLLFGSKYLTAVPIMRILLVASFFNNGIRSSIANILSAVGEQKRNLIVAGIGMALQISLDCFLIPRFGGYGVAVSSAFVYLTMSIILLFIVRKRLYKDPA